MSPNGQRHKAKPANNLYTAILALALLAVFCTVAFVGYKCHVQYGTLFKIP